MSKLIGTSVVAMMCAAVACSDDGASRPSDVGPTPGPTTPTGPKSVEEVQGDLTSSRTLSNTKDYLLKGLVSVKAGSTLTIEKGTKIMGDSGSKAILLVEAGAKIIAEGTADEPIVFTSQAAADVRRAGDWGGIVILGNAPVNFAGGKGNIEGILTTVKGTQYGGSDPNDSSGVLRYVRIEYAGVVLSTDNEVNGLTFGGVGRGTKVDHIMVRHALDDCFEFFGGTVDAHHLICQYNQDDGFDFDNGYQGKLQFLVLQQDPNHSGEDNGIESDNDAQGSANQPFTNPTVYNVTLMGKNADPEAAQFGMLIRRNSRGTYRNIIIHGFESAIDIRDASTALAAQNPPAGEPGLSIAGSCVWNAKSSVVLDNIAFPESGAAAPNKDNDGAFNEVTWFKGLGNLNQDPGIVSGFDPKTPIFGAPAAILTGAATPPSDGFFDTAANYVGAFKDKDDNWATKGAWVSWDSK